MEEDIVHYSQAKGKGYSVIVTADFPYKLQRRNEENIVAEFKRKKAQGCLVLSHITIVSAAPEGRPGGGSK
ncbi:MAG TPA: hypothetical protein VMS89_03995 [Methanoregulaceae archaeon]|nr:hypothetical protein [Methanoregulaceae archaeon]